MNQQPDKFFRDKLKGYQKPVSPDLWKRVSQQPAKRNLVSFWLRIAASTLLLAAAGILILEPEGDAPVEIAESTSRTNNEAIQGADRTAKTIPPGDSELKENVGEATQGKEEGQAQHPAPEKHPTERKKRSVAPPKQNNDMADHSLDSTLPELDGGALYTVETPSEDRVDPSLIAETPEVTETSDNPGVTLVFTAEEVNEKYLDHEALVKATSGANKTSTLKKLLDRAYDLKNNQDPLGDLRQMKNEILALNFKGDKQRKN